MRKLLLLCMIVCVFCAWGGFSGWNEGDIKVNKFSIDGDQTDGLAFDPNSDSVNNIVMNENSIDLTQSGECEINITDDAQTSHSLTVGSDGNLYIDGIIKT